MRTIIALLFSGWLLTAFLPTTQIEITGQIVDKDGAPVPFASIIIKGTTKGVSADQFGYFTIKVPDEKTVLVVSAVGFEASEIKIGKQTKLKVKLTEKVQYLRELEDVVVT
ncbi:MAG: carboxypeptidase-like regulatory domain-containing protein, partial [Sphingobacteriales bacterium]